MGVSERLAHIEVRLVLFRLTLCFHLVYGSPR